MQKCIWLFSSRATRTTNGSQRGTKEHWGGLSSLSPNIHQATRGCLPTGTLFTLFVRDLSAEMWLRIVACLNPSPRKCWTCEGRTKLSWQMGKGDPYAVQDTGEKRCAAWYRACVLRCWSMSCANGSCSCPRNSLPVERSLESLQAAKRISCSSEGGAPSGLRRPSTTGSNAGRLTSCKIRWNHHLQG